MRASFALSGTPSAGIGRRVKARPPGLIVLLAVAFLLCLLSGCATQTHRLLSAPDGGLPPRVELRQTPFFAQEDYQCGPAALAMLLRAAAIPATPEALVPQVYVPARQGSLQPEMLAAARRNGAVAITLPPRLDALLGEVAAGHPVVVLQNLSLPVMPLWHYAVVIGYDLAAGDIILRSGTTERLVMPMTTFENTWRRSDYWSMVALPPGSLPVATSEALAVDALVAFEKSATPERARAAYQAGLARWPHNASLQLGAGNVAYRLGDRDAALQAFLRSAQSAPGNVAALNNAASVLAESGRLQEARELAERAVALGGPLQANAQATLKEIVAKQAGSQ